MEFVLVHGGAHGAWCFGRLVPELAALPGVDGVHAVDLPREVAERVGADRVVRLDSGHSAFVSQPRELARVLVQLAY